MPRQTTLPCDAPHGKIRLPAFTLIELLVVVVILSVLLALLMPALDAAVYQAELAACGAQLKSVGQSVSFYAMDHRRAYPYRATLSQTYWQVSDLYNKYDGTDNDLRSVLEGRINLDLFNCPLAGGVKYGSQETQADVVLGNYEMWFGWGYSGQKVMSRLGDRFTWKDAGGEYRFSLLASDHELMKPGYPQVQATHPDRGKQSMHLWIRYDTPATALNLNRTSTTIGVTYSTWFAPTALANRGEVDRNFTYDDGSVRRITGLRWSTSANTVIDDKGQELIPVPEYNFPDGSTNHRYLPPQ